MPIEETTNQPVRVLVVDDQQIIQQGLVTILKYQPGLEVVGTAANGQEALEQALRLRPDVVLMDVRMPVLDGVAATARLRRELPDCRVLMLTTFDDEEYVMEALRAGATGYLLKDIPGQELAQAIRAVQAGIYQLDPAAAGKLLANLSPTRPGPPSNPFSKAEAALSSGSSSNLPGGLKPGKKTDLTERELQILRLIAAGATNREIAETLVITEGTVKNHISNILSRLNLRDRTNAAIYARENGLL